MNFCACICIREKVYWSIDNNHIDLPTGVKVMVCLNDELRVCLCPLPMTSVLWSSLVHLSSCSKQRSHLVITGNVLQEC